MKKGRIPIPEEIAAKVLFLSDRTCCVCREKEKQVQIHHIDENPSNNDIKNLAVLCFICHDLTQISGGFGRKLDAEQIILYKDDWYRIVARRRGTEEESFEIEEGDSETSLKLATNTIEAYRANKQIVLLANYYNKIGNEELRDIYIEEALRKKPGDDTVIFLRGLQGKPELIPSKVTNRIIKQKSKNHDWTELARIHMHLKDHRKAAKYYVKGINKMLDSTNTFSAAFYLKELVRKGVISALFEISLKESAAKKDLWGQIRALQELGWHSELEDLLIKNKTEIEKSDDMIMQSTLAAIEGDRKKYIKLMAEIAKRTVANRDGTVSIMDDNPSDRDKKLGAPVTIKLKSNQKKANLMKKKKK